MRPTMANTHSLLQSSWLTACYRRTSGALERSWQSSHTLRLGERITRSRLATGVVRATDNSYCYRKLTKEPELTVIVIDLRETYTVGPVVVLLDRLVQAVEPVWLDSTLKRITDGLLALVEAAAQTSAGQSIAALLEPPEPPDERDE